MYYQNNILSVLQRTLKECLNKFKSNTMTRFSSSSNKMSFLPSIFLSHSLDKQSLFVQLQLKGIKFLDLWMEGDLKDKNFWSLGFGFNLFFFKTNRNLKLAKIQNGPLQFFYPQNKHRIISNFDELKLISRFIKTFLRIDLGSQLSIILR